MLSNDDLKKIQKSIKEELRPVKEVVEILQSKMGGFDIYQRSTSSAVRNIKDQQSVMNEKLDDMKTSLDANTASVMEIEATLKAYGDMYKMNQDHVKRLDKRTAKVEKHLHIEPPEDQKIPHFSSE